MGALKVPPERLLPPAALHANQVVWFYGRPNGNGRFLGLLFFLCCTSKTGEGLVNFLDEVRHVTNSNSVVAHMGCDDVGCDLRKVFGRHEESLRWMFFANVTPLSSPGAIDPPLRIAFTARTALGAQPVWIERPERPCFRLPRGPSWAETPATPGRAVNDGSW